MRLVVTKSGAALAAVVVALAAVVALAGPARASNDTFFARQWALEQIGAPRAWTVSRGAGIVIGVIDSGVDAGHPDLAGKIVANADCVGRPCLENAGGADPRGHGTSVSGVAVANADNAIGIAGVAPDAKVAVAKVLGPTGEATLTDVDAAIRWAISRGARVINISLGDANVATGNPLRESVEYAWSRGAVPVLAAGNFGSASENYGSINALVVGATDRNGSVASYSSPVGNAKWGLVAPGGSGVSGTDNNVISTAVGGGYSSSAGTSMAAPHVSATIALLLAQGLSPSAAVNRLLGTLDRVSCGAGCQGRLNAASAVGAGAAVVPVVTAPPATSPPATVAVTRPPATVKPKVAAPAVTTTVPAPPPTTTPPPTVPPEVVAAVVDPGEGVTVALGGAGGAVGLGGGPEEFDGRADLVALAVLLALGAAAATAGVGSHLQNRRL